MPTIKPSVAAVVPASPAMDFKSLDSTARSVFMASASSSLAMVSRRLPVSKDGKDVVKVYNAGNLQQLETDALHLTSASFKGFEFNADTWGVVKNGLAKATRLQFLILSHVTFLKGKRLLQGIFNPLKSTLKLLDLGANRLEDSDIEDLIPFLQNNAQLRELVAYGNNISAKGMRKLCAALETCASLQRFIISGVPCGQDGMQAYVELLTHKSQLARDVFLNGYRKQQTIYPPAKNQVNIFLAALSGSVAPPIPAPDVDAKHLVADSKAPQSIASKLKFESLKLSNFELTGQAANTIAELIKEEKVVRLSLLKFSFDNEEGLKKIFTALTANQLQEFRVQPSGGTDDLNCWAMRVNGQNEVRKRGNFRAIKYVAMVMMRDKSVLQKLVFEFQSNETQNEYFIFAQGLLLNDSLKKLAFNYPQSDHDKLIMDFALLMNEGVTNLTLLSKPKNKELDDFANHVQQRNAQKPLAPSVDAKQAATPVSSVKSEEEIIDIKLLATRWILGIMLFAQTNNADHKTEILMNEWYIKKELARNPNAKVYEHILQLRNRLAEVVKDAKYGKKFQPTLDMLNRRMAEELEPLVRQTERLELNNAYSYASVGFWACATLVTLGGCCGSDRGCHACNASPIQLATRSETQRCVPLTDFLLSVHTMRQNAELEQLRQAAISKPVTPVAGR